MSNEMSYSGILGDLQSFQASMEAKINEVPHLGATRVLLVETLGQIQDLAKRQAAVIAEKQDLSQQLQAAVSDGRRLATLLRKGLQHHYGIRSEALAEFGLQPFRGRKLSSKKKAAKPAPTTPAEAAPSVE